MSVFSAEMESKSESAPREAIVLSVLVLSSLVASDAPICRYGDLACVPEASRGGAGLPAPGVDVDASEYSRAGITQPGTHGRKLELELELTSRSLVHSSRCPWYQYSRTRLPRGTTRIRVATRSIGTYSRYVSEYLR